MTRKEFEKFLKSGEVPEIIETMPKWDSEQKRAFISYSIATHGGKMSDIPSISTACTLNSRCVKRHALNHPDCICSHCYAFDILNGFKGKAILRKLELNTAFYTTVMLTASDVPFINAAFFRFEAFGDLINPAQVHNYYTIAKNNKHCNFTLWTKNPDIAARCTTKKPHNMRVIFSPLNTDLPITSKGVAGTIKKYPFISGAFFVYNANTARPECNFINCGKRCNKCLKCYKPIEEGGFDLIIETLK